ncbi:hypothetical protein WR25_18869 [Diploscapter pachys]|uniref:SXP/RAL-2 family protein Ani s 5-like cation-binding domain-containing protein n=1 Tax=Diploscapter pachys TaxID=2018661 RepID=A0A2A2J6Y7_9BILA|nr:hypothetical protein WR25_03437 [Diploscapter pachys]PAV93111.1 hypothetical protein WR25_18869 [Diploscapter pachys]
MRHLILISFVLILSISFANADWFDDLTDKITGGFHSAGQWVKDTASPAVRGKFNEAKEKLQDPETHKTIREWLSDKADKIANFTKTEIAPELKKIYEAATADSNEKKD